MRAAKTAPMAAAAAAAGTPVGPAPLEELDGDGNAETMFDGTGDPGAVELATVESEPETVAVEALGLVLTPTVMVLTPTVVALDFWRPSWWLWTWMRLNWRLRCQLWCPRY